MILFEPLEQNWKLDPLVENLDDRKIKEDVTKYLALIDSETTEAKLHTFLASHSYFFNGILRMYGASPLYSKIKLGHNYEVDFAWFDSGSDGPEWRLAEIESPANSMFKKSGEPSSTLLRAIQQLRDWHSWTHENLDYARKLMPYIEYPLGYVFVGRRFELTSDSARKKLRRLAYEHRMFLRIHTLDWFAGSAESVTNLVRNNNRGNWPVPMKALSHSMLAKGLPKHTLEWLDSPTIRELSRRGLENRLRERDHDVNSV